MSNCGVTVTTVFTSLALAGGLFELINWRASVLSSINKTLSTPRYTEKSDQYCKLRKDQYCQNNGSPVKGTVCSNEQINWILLFSSHSKVQKLSTKIKNHENTKILPFFSKMYFTCLIFHRGKLKTKRELIEPIPLPFRAYLIDETVGNNRDVFTDF